MKKDQNIIYYLFSISLVIVQIVFLLVKKKHFLEYIWGSSFIILSIVVFVLILIIPITKKKYQKCLDCYCFSNDNGCNISPWR